MKSGARSAFTLLEIMAVVVLIGIVCAGAVLRFGPVLENARLGASADQLVDFEALVRRVCQNSNQSAALRFDLQESKLEAQFVSGKQSQSADEAELRHWRAIPGVRLKNVQLPGRHFKVHNQVRVRISAEGTSPTYALCLATAREERWLVVIGRSGRVFPCQEERDVRQILQASSETWSDDR